MWGISAKIVGAGMGSVCVEQCRDCDVTVDCYPLYCNIYIAPQPGKGVDKYLVTDYRGLNYPRFVVAVVVPMSGQSPGRAAGEMFQKIFS